MAIKRSRGRGATRLRRPSLLPALVGLEERTLLSSITLVDKTLIIDSSQNTHDTAVLGYMLGSTPLFVVDGASFTIPVSVSDLTAISVTGCDSGDYVDLSGLTGFHGSVTIDGGAGNDTLIAGPGMESLFGGAGDDSIVGGLEGDTLSGGAGNDTISGTGGLSAALGDLILGGEGNDRIRGTPGNDTIITGTGNSTVSAGAGNDSIGTGGGE